MTISETSSEDADGWIEACHVDDVPEDEGWRVDVDPPIALFKVEDEILATSDTCTHEVSSLAEGYVDGDVVECAFHFAKFCLRTGAVLAFPATEPLDTYDTRVADDGTVFVRSTPRPAAS